MNKEGFVELLGSIVAGMSSGLTIRMSDGRGRFTEVKEPKINYIFGSDQYVKDKIDEYSKTPAGVSADRNPKFPLVAFLMPVTEQRDGAFYFSKAKVSLLIACSSRKEWSNEQRLETSFKNVLRPVYERLMDALRNDSRLLVGYDEVLTHTYSENYSYGRYGAYTQRGDAVSEPIDAINIGSLELKIKVVKCDDRFAARNRR